MTELTQDQLLALVSKLQAENKAKDAALAKAKAQSAARISLKVGEKGTVCLNHGSRYPIAIYASQWERIIPFIKSGAIEKFIAENAELIARRED